MKDIKFSYTRQKHFSGFDGKFCKIYPVTASDGKILLMCYSHLLLTGSDVFFGKYVTKSFDNGKTFDEPCIQENLKDIFSDGVRKTQNLWPLYNKKHNKWLGFGNAEFYADDKHPILRGGIAVSEPLFSKLDAENGQFYDCEVLDFPFEYTAVTPILQFIEYDNGDVLIPFYFVPKDNPKSCCVTVRYDISGDKPKVVEYGKPLSDNKYPRGICEPSIAKLGDKIYMTIRCDDTALWSVSDDGFNFGELHEWTFDDGTVIGCYNTQQHWVINKDGLFLAYTRKGAHNDHVFRHRAPIFMARFDEENGCLIKESEVILVPELGARLGNFHVIETPDGALLTVAEWMQGLGCEKYGSDNTIWVTHINWEE